MSYTFDVQASELISLGSNFIEQLSLSMTAAPLGPGVLVDRRGPPNLA
jgi:hypothetical protein